MTVQPLAFQIDNMSCASCVGRVERSLRAVPGVTEARVNLASERAEVHVVWFALSTLPWSVAQPGIDIVARTVCGKHRGVGRRPASGTIPGNFR